MKENGRICNVLNELIELRLLLNEMMEIKQSRDGAVERR